jgi:Tol biopolymer transport system component
MHAEDWSPDGRTILAVRSQEDGTKQIVLIPTDSGAVQVLKTVDWREPRRASFSPDGRFIVYDFPTVEESNDHRDLFVIDRASGRERRLVKHPANDYLLGWGPDGEHVLFASDRGGTPGAWLQTVIDGDPKGEPVLVKADLWNVTEGQFVANGSFIYTVQTGSRQISVASLDPRSGKVIGAARSLTPAVTGRVADPQWSPDGRSVSYTTSMAGRGLTLTIRSMESGAARVIPIPTELVYSFHRWARDGKSLVISGAPKGRTGIFRLDLRSGRAAPIFMLERKTVIPGGRAFDLTPDNTVTAYVRSAFPAKGKWSPRSGAARPRDPAGASALSSRQERDRTLDRDLSRRPQHRDHRRVRFDREAGGGPARWWSGAAGRRVVRAEGKFAARLEPRWESDLRGERD